MKIEKNRKTASIIDIPEADRKLAERCQAGLIRLFGEKPPKAVKDRLNHELKTVADNGHSSIYLLACMLSEEAVRLKHAIFFRGVITSSLIAYTGGFSEVNPMEAEYGGINLPFEVTGEEFSGNIQGIDIDCSYAFIVFAQSFMCRLFPEYRCLSYPLNCEEKLRAVRIYLAPQNALPVDEVFDNEDMMSSSNPDYMFLDEYFHLTLISHNEMELVRNNMFFDPVEPFRECDCEKLIPQLWRYSKKYDEAIRGFKGLKVCSYEDLINVIGMAHSTNVWGGVVKKMILDRNLLLSDTIGTRDELLSIW